VSEKRTRQVVPPHADREAEIAKLTDQIRRLEKQRVLSATIARPSPHEERLARRLADLRSPRLSPGLEYDREATVPLTRAAAAAVTDPDLLVRMQQRIAELEAQMPNDPQPTHGPKPATTREEVDRTRRLLADRGKPTGERAIGAYLGVSRDAVRYALGKDRRPRSTGSPD
jgi:hypothetical protein